MLAFTHSRAAKVEPQHREAESAERLHGVIHNFVVHGAAK
jgi:hypothetical protein